MHADLAGLPDQIGRYEVRGLLGRGGMGRVVAGHDSVLRRNVAIKLVEPTAVSLDDLAELRYMFHREARATAALRHPNIVEVFDYSGPQADLMFIACELIDGPTLAEVIDGRGPLAAPIAAAIGYELAQALVEAHDAGIIHRDLKPENVFWTRAGRVVLGDFGIAKAFDGSDKLGATIQFGGTSLYGSPSYMAPEQLTGGDVGPRTDIYALGAVLYESISGRQVFAGEEIQAILDAVVAGEHVALDTLVTAPPRLHRLIEAMLAVDPIDRPASATHVAQELRRTLDDCQVSDPRLCLRDFGDATAVELAAMASDARDDPEEDNEAEADGEARRLFEPRRDEHIQVRAPASVWTAIAARGPVVLGMLAFAVALGAGVFLLTKLSVLAESGAAFVTPAEPTVSTATESPPTASDANDIFVLLRFAGRQTIFVDGTEVGTWSDRVRLAIAPGRHSIEVRSPTGNVARDVLLLRGTRPEFVLSADPSAADSTDPR